MTRAGRYGCAVVARLSIVRVAARADSLAAAQCETDGSGNQQALQSLNALLGKDHGNTTAYLVHARCFYFLGAYAPAVQNASEVIRRDPSPVHPDAHDGRALTYVREFLGKDREALTDFAAAFASTLNTSDPIKSAPKSTAGTINVKAPSRILKWCSS
mgnify:CR=1 FL=1